MKKCNEFFAAIRIGTILLNSQFYYLLGSSHSSFSFLLSRVIIFPIKLNAIPIIEPVLPEGINIRGYELNFLFSISVISLAILSTANQSSISIILELTSIGIIRPLRVTWPFQRPLLHSLSGHSPFRISVFQTQEHQYLQSVYSVTHPCCNPTGYKQRS